MSHIDINYRSHIYESAKRHFVWTLNSNKFSSRVHNESAVPFTIKSHTLHSVMG